MSESGPLTEDQVDDLLDRTCDTAWLAGMRSQPDGQAILASKKAVFARSSLSIMAQADCCSISTAPTGSPGRCNLYAARAAGGPAFVAPAGTKFLSSSGVALVLALDVPVAAGQINVLLPLETLRFIDLVNTADPTFDDLLSPGDALAPIMAAENDPTVAAVISGWTYASSTPTIGATMDWLSVLGQERGCFRQPGEDGENYRLRVRAIPDAVTPNAIAEAVHGAQVQGNLPSVYIVEPLRDQASDAARLAINLLFADSVFCDDGFCDDPLGADLPGKLPFRTCETPSIREGRAYFRLSVAGALHEPDGLVLYADDGFCDDSAWGYPDIGMHPALEVALRGIQEEARVKKAAGVQFDTYIENSTRVDGFASVVAAPGGTLAFSLSAPTGQAWLLREGLVSIAGLNPATDAFWLNLVLVGGGLVSTGWISALDSFPLRTFTLEKLGYFSAQIASIVLTVKSSVSNTLQAVGTFWTTQMTL